MKKTLSIITSIFTLFVLLSCSNSNSGKSRGTSLVTITIGTAGKTAQIAAHQATPLARAKAFLTKSTPAGAGIISAGPPINVASINLTVAANDMATITETANISAGQTEVTITVEVPNGLNRLFTVTGFASPGATGNITYAGGMSADLNGSDLVLPISMINLGSVTNILYVSTTGDDKTGDGTLQKPYRTITKALTIFPNGSVGILVWPGMYDYLNLTGPETFPLQLQTASALAGLGPSHAVVLRSGSNGINGAPGAYIDNLRIFVCDSTGIDDLGFITHINNVLLDSSSSCLGGAGDGIVLATDSTVSNTTIKDPFTSGITISSGNPVISNTTIIVTGTQPVLPFYGINVVAGNPTISNSTINGFFGDGAGRGILLGAGNGTVSQCSMSGNGGGISISGGSPTITGNTISNNSGDGIILSSSIAAPNATISGNSINHNGYGIYASAVGTSSITNNSLYCNATTDFYLADSTANGFNISSNAWDHDSKTSPPGPTTSTDSPTFCTGGVDICYSSLLTPPPVSTPTNTAVSGGCL